MSKNIEIIQPDDWHVHFREGDMLEMVTNFSSRINKRCVAMPNTEIPITDTNKAFSYRESLKNASDNNFEPLIPCYLNESLDLNNFRLGIQNKVFFGSRSLPDSKITYKFYRKFLGIIFSNFVKFLFCCIGNQAFFSLNCSWMAGSTVS